jgi:hypothetical protein
VNGEGFDDGIDERLRNTGRGQYEYDGFDENGEPFKILVHTTYAAQDRAYFQGYEWRKLG